MNYLLNQKIIRFHSSEPIHFDGMEGGKWTPAFNRDYTFGIDDISNGSIVGSVVLLDENPASPGGIDRSEPVSKDRFQIVGDRKVVVSSSYYAGFAAQMTDHCRLFLESEINNHESMSAEEASKFRCDLDSAQGSLKQMDNRTFVEIMEISETAQEEIVNIKSGVEEEIDRLIESLGGASVLQKILVRN